MATSHTPQENYRFAVELTKDDVPTIKEFLKRIEITDDVSRVSIEIESSSPILGRKPESGEEEEETGDEPSTEVIKHDKDDSPERDESEPEAPNLKAPISVGTNAWKIAATLYRTQGFVTLGQLDEITAGTNWDVPYKSISATLSQLNDKGIVQSKKVEGAGGHGYQLTQAGRDHVKELNNKSEGYILKTADHITGKAPTSDREPFVGHVESD